MIVVTMLLPFILLFTELSPEITGSLKYVMFILQNNKALQEACGMLEEQLTDLEKLADIHEIKNKDLEV